MKRAVMLIAVVLCLGAWAADNAAVDRQSVVHSPSSIVNGVDAITIPQMMSYQGKLTDTAGMPVADTTYSVMFRLYTVPSGGSSFWYETQLVRTRGGLFSTLLGSVIPIGSMPDAGAAYLGMSVSGGTELAPRLRIASAAYAYLTARAANADLLQGKDTTALDGRYVNEGQANAVTGAMLVDGTVKTADIGDTSVTMAKFARAGATTGQVVKWTGSAWAPRNDSVGQGGTADNAWVRVGGDSVLYTIRQLGIARGGSGNVLYGNMRQTHTNLGVSCTTGTSGQNNGYATVGGGWENAASGLMATVGGGTSNLASGMWATIGGGSGNRAPYSSATVGGGIDNVAGASSTTVGGGENNLATDQYATVAGGHNNTASGADAIVSGGYGNAASGDYSTVAGGVQDTASAIYATVGGGQTNTASAQYTTVGGGWNNIASGDIATVAGGSNNTASGMWATIGGGSGNLAHYNSATVGGGTDNAAWANYATVSGGNANSATGQYATVGGGTGNTASVTEATVSGGNGNAASGAYSTVGGGLYDTVSAQSATVAGGQSNTASGLYSTVGGGLNNSVSGLRATVAGGSENIASARDATIAGGSNNTATGQYATVSGGYDNVASGDYAVVAGGVYDTSAASYSFTTNDHSVVPSGFINSAAFNGQRATASNQTRVGALSKASGTFTIDHPLDPHGKILNHYFIEGPEMLNIYRGSAVLDGSGRAVVTLPDYFDVLNRNPMVQLTGVGTREVIYVAEDVSGNRFAIGGPAGAKVYWQVTGERQDVSAEITRRLMPVEQPKTGVLAGTMLDDDFLRGAMDQLVREGKAQGIDFRTAAGRQRYEKTKQLTGQR